MVISKIIFLKKGLAAFLIDDAVVLIFEDILGRAVERLDLV